MSKTSETREIGGFFHQVFEKPLGNNNPGYKTVIEDGDKISEGVGDTPERAQEQASQRWEEKYGDDD